MRTKISTIIRRTAIYGLAFALVLSAAWAVETYHDDEKVHKKHGGNLNIASHISGCIEKGALDTYLEEQGINKVTITVDVIDYCDGRLDFTFGPSGAHFEPCLELEIAGDYAKQNMFLTNEEGEVVEYTVKNGNGKLTFYIPHFSSYIYDHYDY